MTFRVVVLVSGTGTLLQSLIDNLPEQVSIVAVGSDQPDAVLYSGPRRSASRPSPSRYRAAMRRPLCARPGMLVWLTTSPVLPLT